MKKGNTTPAQKGQLINKAGKGRYCGQESIESLIRYIARKNDNPKDDLICCGAFGATDFTDIDVTIRQFECVQKLHKRNGNFGRYIDHEIYSFSAEEEQAIRQHGIPVENLARKMASDIYKDGFQVYYSVHEREHGTNRLHIHFAVNTVSFQTGKKRHENIQETEKREKRMNQIAADEIARYSAK